MANVWGSWRERTTGSEHAACISPELVQRGISSIIGSLIVTFVLVSCLGFPFASQSCCHVVRNISSCNPCWGLFVSVTIARAIELKHSSGLVAALANETATLYTDAGVYAGVLSVSLYLEDNCSKFFVCTCCICKLIMMTVGWTEPLPFFVSLFTEAALRVRRLCCWQTVPWPV